MVRFSLTLLLLASALTSTAYAGGWRHVTTDKGVRVDVRDIKGQDFPEFRGIKIFKADIFDILAVLDDSDRHCEWHANCKVMRVVRKINEFDRLLYHRLNAPWPVSDRDMVLHGSVRVDWTNKTVTSPFRSVSGVKPPQSGAVRMKALRGYFRFKLLSGGRVKATYQVYSDPAGWLPAWLVRAASKGIPIKTLNGLERQVRKTKGSYGAFMRKYNPAQGGSIPARFQTGQAKGEPVKGAAKVKDATKAPQPTKPRP